VDSRVIWGTGEGVWDFHSVEDLPADKPLPHPPFSSY
jgi:hypothetical protein